jgi:hypothetical protein
MEANSKLYYYVVAMQALRTTILLGLALAPAFAVDMPTGFFRGAMVRWEGTNASGTVTAQNANGIFDCHYDKKSWMELEKRHVTVDKLLEGDRLEILADRHPGETACYVLTLEVLPPPPPPKRPRPKATPARATISRPTAIRHGQDNFAGVVARIDNSTVTIHTRDGDQSFQLRSDTRYVGDGLRMEHSDVVANMRLSVEASRNHDGEWEAFQLTWGSISVH